MRNAFTKGHGSIGTQGCVSYMFDEKGQIIVAKEDYEGDADELMMQALDAGAEDFSEEEDSYEILTAPDDFEDVRRALEDAGIPMAEASVTMLPQNYVELTAEEDLTNITVFWIFWMQMMMCRKYFTTGMNNKFTKRGQTITDGLSFFCKTLEL